jgi:ABC-type polysaccharide/polyol phosphate export permease
MIMKMLNYGKTLQALLLADFVIFKKEYLNKIINVMIVTSTQILVTVHILPYFGLRPDFGLFMLGAWLSSYPLWEGYPMIANLISDISGEKKITYELLLPIPSSIVFLRLIISFALQSIATSILIIPLGKLFLPVQFDFSNVSWIACIVMFFVNSIFIGSFSIFVVSMIRHISSLEAAWQRFIFPLWFLGGFEFSWVAFHAIFPKASYLLLFNPIIYSNEGFRHALLQDESFIPTKICVIVLFLFASFFAIVGFKRLKKRLDFI